MEVEIDIIIRIAARLIGSVMIPSGDVCQDFQKLCNIIILDDTLTDYFQYLLKITLGTLAKGKVNS